MLKKPLKPNTPEYPEIVAALRVADPSAEVLASAEIDRIRRRDAPERLGTLRMYWAEAALKAGNLPAARRRIAQAIEMLAPTPYLASASRSHRLASLVELLDGKIDTAERHATSAEAIARTIRPGPSGISTHKRRAALENVTARFRVLHARGRAGELYDEWEEVTEIAESPETDPWNRAEHRLVGAVLVLASDRGRAESLARAGLDVLRTHAMRFDLAWWLAVWGSVAGDAEAAREGVRLARAIPNAPLAAHCSRLAPSRVSRLHASDAEVLELLRPGEICPAGPYREAARRVVGAARHLQPLRLLVFGESGVGKQLIAELAHRASPHRHGAFEVVLPRPTELMASELQGHRRGAFTGAANDQKGLFEICSTGTLFLDEIDAWPEPIQTMFLTFFNGGIYRPIGATESRRSSAQVVAATNKDLPALVDCGRFREDLYYRLRDGGSDLVEIPPLRDRPAELGEWANAFLATSSPDDHPPSLSPGALAELQQYPWPGNLRALKTVVVAARNRTTEPQITAEQIREAVQATRLPGMAPTEGARHIPSERRDHVLSSVPALAHLVDALSRDEPHFSSPLSDLLDDTYYEIVDYVTARLGVEPTQATELARALRMPRQTIQNRARRRRASAPSDLVSAHRQ